MKVVSVTVTSDRAGVIGPALQSVVPHVDLCLLVDMGMDDQTTRIATDILGEKMRVVVFPGEKWLTGEARNLGLQESYRLGGDWALNVDTDERAAFGDGWREALEAIGEGVVYCPMDGGLYTKERFIHLPAADIYSYVDGHECIYPEHSKQEKLDHVMVEEVRKTPEQLRAKCEWLVPFLQERTAKNPNDPRNWYYLGDALAGLGRKDEAIKAFDKCASLRGWDEESAWSCFRLALLLEETGHRLDALCICAAGLTRHAGMAELAWLAGELNYRSGHHDQAVYWARMAVANGTTRGEQHWIKPRIGFRYPHGLDVGPYELMAKAYAALGRQDEAAKARGLMDELTTAS